MGTIVVLAIEDVVGINEACKVNNKSYCPRINIIISASEQGSGIGGRIKFHDHIPLLKSLVYFLILLKYL